PVIIGRLEAGDPDLTLRMYQKVCTVLGVKTTFSVD
ncbi:transcriptional regulator, partial [Listeria monocytogenes]|nr:transcriptional regulator [Listeria monocytogenes]